MHFSLFDNLASRLSRALLWVTFALLWIIFAQPSLSSESAPGSSSSSCQNVYGEDVSGASGVQTLVHETSGYEPLVQVYTDENPYLTRGAEAQRKFLESLGVRILPKSSSGPAQVIADKPLQIARQINQKIQTLLAFGEISGEGLLLWPSIQVDLESNQLVFLPLEQHPPEGQNSPVVGPNAGRYVTLNHPGLRMGNPDDISLQGRLEYLISDVGPRPNSLLQSGDYLMALSQGFFPSAFSRFNVGYRAPQLGLVSGTESLFLHDLAHWGGFLELPEAMSLVAKAGRVFWTHVETHGTLNAISTSLQNRFFFFNEVAEFLKPNAMPELNEILDIQLNQSVDSIVSGYFTGASEGGERISGPHPEVGYDPGALRQALIEFFEKHVIVFGGTARTPLTHVELRPHLQRTYLQLLQADPARDAQLIWDKAVDFVYFAQALSEMDVAGWETLLLRPHQKARDGFWNYFCSKVGRTPAMFRSFRDVFCL